MFRFQFAKKNKKQTKNTKNGTDLGTAMWTSLLLPKLCVALFLGSENGLCFWARFLEACAQISGRRHIFLNKFVFAVMGTLSRANGSGKRLPSAAAGKSGKRVTWGQKRAKGAASISAASLRGCASEARRESKCDPQSSRPYAQQ